MLSTLWYPYRTFAPLKPSVGMPHGDSTGLEGTSIMPGEILNGYSAQTVGQALLLSCPSDKKGGIV